MGLWLVCACIGVCREREGDIFPHMRYSFTHLWKPTVHPVSQAKQGQAGQVEGGEGRGVLFQNNLSKVLVKDVAGAEGGEGGAAEPGVLNGDIHPELGWGFGGLGCYTTSKWPHVRDRARRAVCLPPSAPSHIPTSASLCQPHALTLIFLEQWCQLFRLTLPPSLSFSSSLSLWQYACVLNRLCDSIQTKDPRIILGGFVGCSCPPVVTRNII